MTQEIIDIGELANDGTGDPLRVAFDKINNNFTQLYNTASVDGPNGSVQFALANTVGNVTTYSLSSSANLVFNSSTNRLDIKGTIVPLVPNNLNIGSTANTVGNLYLSNTGLKLGNVSFSESANTVRIFNTNANIDANIQVNTITASTVDVAVSDTSANNQSVTITINKSTSGGSVKYVVYGTTFNGDPVTRYDVDVAFGNVRIKVNPLVNDLITHTISYQVTN